MPPSGSVPLKPFLETRNKLTARITRRPLPGSVPSKWFELITKFLAVPIDVMPPSGSVPLRPFW
eukprot:3819981-Amphidinium_carterae.1